MSLVLIVDDAKSNAQLIEAALQVTGYEVVSAVTADIGLQLADELTPDLFIIDLRLPGSSIDGWELINMLRSNQRFQQVPIIVTAVQVKSDDEYRAYDAGCNAYFSKPFKITELRDAIASFIGVP